MTELARALLREWRADRMSGLAAEVAFFALLSLFPLLLALAAALGSLDRIIGDDLAADARDEVVGMASRVLTEEGDEMREAIEGLFGQQRPGVITVASLAAVGSASRGFHALLDALRVVYDEEEPGSWIRRRAMAVVLALGSVAVGAVLLGALVAGPLLGTGQDVADAVGAGGAWAWAWDVARWPVVALVAIAWCATILHVAHPARTRWRLDVPGAAFAAGWGLAATAGLRIYVELASGTNPVLGTLGGTIVAVLWLYLAAIGVLLGGEINNVLAHRRRSGA